MTPHRRQLLGAAPLSPEVRAWSASVAAAGGGVSSARRKLVNGLIQTLKSAGVWNALDRLWLFAAENSTAALIDLVARSTATAVNSPTFTADRGYTGNGTSSYLDSNFNPGTAPGPKQYAANDASFGTWVVTPPTTVNGFEVANEFGAYSFFATRWSSVNRRWEVNSASNPSTPLAHGGEHTGFFHGERVSSTAGALYRNGSPLMTTDATSIGVIPNRKVFILGYVHTSTPSNFSNAQIGAVHVGRSLGAEGQARLYAALRTYMTAVGVP